MAYSSDVPGEDLGDPAGPVPPPHDRESPEHKMRVRLTWASLTCALIAWVGEIVAAAVGGSTGLQVALTGMAGVFTGLLLSAGAYWFSADG